MKKHLIAAAVASAIAVPAMAQVTVYGLFDVGYGQTTASLNNVEQRQTQLGGRDSANGNGGLSGSRLGFRGEEDLGAGLKASFVFEMAIRPATNSVTETTGAAVTVASNPIANLRNGWVGLSHATYGSIQLGTLNTQVKDVYDVADPGGGNNFVGTLFGMYSTGREYGAIRYTSPVMSGFQVRASYTPSEATGAVSADAGQSISLTYTAGNLYVGAAQDVRKNVTYSAATGSGSLVDILNAAMDRADATGAASVTDKIVQDVIGATYNFGVAKAHYVYTRVKLTDATAADEGGVSGNLVGITVPVLSNVNVFGSVSKGSHTDTGAKNYDFDAYQLGAVYTLSPRTNVYGVVAQLKGDHAVAANDFKVRQAQLGIRHSF